MYNSDGSFATTHPSGRTQMAGDVIQFPNPSSTPNTDAAKNKMAVERGAVGPNVIKIPDERYK